jgi:hypothetical protein
MRDTHYVRPERRFRLFGTLLGLIGLLALQACGSGQSGPTTPVEWNGISANLPGEGWRYADEQVQGSLHTTMWESADKSLVFRISNNPDGFVESGRPSFDDADWYMGLMNYPSSSSSDSTTLFGRRAIRMEAIYPESDTDDYRMVEYAFISGFQPYFVGAGAKASTWRKGGGDSVEAILHGVKIGSSK